MRPPWHSLLVLVPLAVASHARAEAPASVPAPIAAPALTHVTRAELTFAYRTTCTSDVSPFELKLFLLEQSVKLALRGSTQVDVGGGELVGGDKRADPALAKQPTFARHLEQVWARIVALDPWS